MKKYNKILYIDVGMKIHNSIQPLLQLDCKNSILAHSDAYPTFERKLTCQFRISSDPSLGKMFIEEFGDCNRDYFQTSIMIYDTSIIQNDTFDQLKYIMFKYPFSVCNDQGIISLYYEPYTNSENNKRKVWKNLDPSLYDYSIRNKSINYIMTKT